MTKFKWMRGWDHPAVADIQVVCYHCGRTILLSKGWVDVKGKPFKAYYCDECKEMTDARLEK